MQISFRKTAALANQTGLQQMEAMGFRRAVLARELSLEEIAAVAAATTLELEIFIHGALCFSYSGLCLASSFFGGRSSLRGRCVQPCRRRYRAGGDHGYFLSPNDLSAIDLIPAIRKLRIAALKIEGRMKPASYVAAVVSAYRLVLDAAPGEEQAAVAQARRSLRQALGRKPTHGFLVAEERRDVITPQRVGASGQLAAAVERVQGDAMSLRLRVPLAAGDRLRLDSDEGFEKKAFRLREMSLRGRPVTTAEAGALVRVPRIPGARAGDRLFHRRACGVSTTKGSTEDQGKLEHAERRRVRGSVWPCSGWARVKPSPRARRGHAYANPTRGSRIRSPSHNSRPPRISKQTPARIILVMGIIPDP